MSVASAREIGVYVMVTDYGSSGNTASYRVFIAGWAFRSNGLAYFHAAEPIDFNLGVTLSMIDLQSSSNMSCRNTLFDNC